MSKQLSAAQKQRLKFIADPLTVSAPPPVTYFESTVVKQWCLVHNAEWSKLVAEGMLCRKAL